MTSAGASGSGSTTSATSRRSGRDPAVRVPGVDVAAAGEGLRHLVSRVPPDLHAPRGGPQRYVKLDHEFIGRAAYEKEAETGPERRLVALVVEPDPDAPADVIGDEPIWHDGEVVGWVTSGGYGHHVEKSIALGYVPTALADAGRRAATASRSRSSAGAGRPGSSPSRCSTPRASGCASERGRREALPAAAAGGGRIVVDGRPVAFEAGRHGRDRDPARRRGPRARRHALPGRRLRQLSRRGRRHRLRPDVPDRGPRRAAGRAGIRAMRCRHSPWWPPRT